MKIITAAVLLFFGSLSAAEIDKLKALESSTEGRIGVFAVNTANDHRIEYRANETFPTRSTSKVIGVSAVLKKSMSDPSLLLTNVKYSEEELGEWSPVTGQYVASGMTIQDLCGASISFSDNTAVNNSCLKSGALWSVLDCHLRAVYGARCFGNTRSKPAEISTGIPVGVLLVSTRTFKEVSFADT